MLSALSCTVCGCVLGALFWTCCLKAIHLSILVGRRFPPIFLETDLSEACPSEESVINKLGKYERGFQQKEFRFQLQLHRFCDSISSQVDF